MIFSGFALMLLNFAFIYIDTFRWLIEINFKTFPTRAHSTPVTIMQTTNLTTTTIINWTWIRFIATRSISWQNFIAWTATLETARGICTNLTAIVEFAITFIDIYARSHIIIEIVARWTFTIEPAGVSRNVRHKKQNEIWVKKCIFNVNVVEMRGNWKFYICIHPCSMFSHRWEHGASISHSFISSHFIESSSFNCIPSGHEQE